MINQSGTRRKKTETELRANDFKAQIECRDLELSKSASEMTEIIRIGSTASDADSELNIDISIEEAVKTLKSVKNTKSGGPDGTACEMLKNILQETALILMKLFNDIQNKCQIPWGSSWTVPIYKNGDKSSLSSYRRIN